MDWRETFFCFLLLITWIVALVSGQDLRNNPKATLLHAIIITRHGDRTPTHTFPNSLSDWNEGLGELTHLGMKQHHDLGKQFREKYIHKWKLVNATWNNDEIYVRSSPKDRTIMSAQSFLLGFFPPTTKLETNLIHETYHSTTTRTGLPDGHQIVPVYTAPKEHDNLLYAYKSCPKLKEIKKQDESLSEWKQTHSEHADLLEELSSLLGTSVNLKDVTGIVNLINAEKIHQKPSLDGITEVMYNRMVKLTDWIFRKKFPSKEAGKLGAGLLVKEIRDRMERTISAHKNGAVANERFVLFSGHDGTLLALMAALDLSHLDVPHYASHFTFELYHIEDGDGDTSNDYSIQILYNNYPVTLPNCTDMCEWNDFTEIIVDSIPKNWHVECQSSQKETPNTKYLWLMDVSPAGLVYLGFGFAVGVLFKTLTSFRQKAQKTKSQ
mmetsp:Transcript_6802/g.9402  ORF Transcript_6802/g.9402 Transcript_6802/m.9402 type:complete len:438 (+) Transcript_6802:29-1342(+)